MPPGPPAWHESENSRKPAGSGKRLRARFRPLPVFVDNDLAGAIKKHNNPLRPLPEAIKKNNTLFGKLARQELYEEGIVLLLHRQHTVLVLPAPGHFPSEPGRRDEGERFLLRGKLYLCQDEPLIIAGKNVQLDDEAGSGHRNIEALFRQDFSVRFFAEVEIGLLREREVILLPGEKPAGFVRKIPGIIGPADADDRVRGKVGLLNIMAGISGEISGYIFLLNEKFALNLHFFAFQDE